LPAFRELWLVLGVVGGVTLLVAVAGLLDLAGLDRRPRPATDQDDQEPVEGVYGIALLGAADRVAAFGRAPAVFVSDARTGEPLTAFADFRSSI
jgi:hypothetical protein